MSVSNARTVRAMLLAKSNGAPVILNPVHRPVARRRMGRKAMVAALLSGVALGLLVPSPGFAQNYGATGGGPLGGAAGNDGAGPAGGAAGTSVSPDGGTVSPGNGGGGGYSNTATGDVNLPLQGGNGGNGGGGGGGGDGVRFLSSVAATISAAVAGGNGGNGLGAGTGGGGGGGGAGVVWLGNGYLTTSGQISGGNGGGLGGPGGGGGAGVVLQDAGHLTASGGIRGGDGGDSYFDRTANGNAGAGVVMAGGGSVTTTANGSIRGGNIWSTGLGGAGVEALSGGSVVNAGTIRGGNGGSGNDAGPSDVNAGGTGSGGALGFIPGSGSSTRSAGGAGIIGADLSVINSGSIAGGAGYSGQANAITFTGGINSLELRHGSTLIGDVVAGGASDSLVLGGDTDSTFDLSNIVPASTGAGNEYIGFELFEKTGTSTFVLTGDGFQDWTISAGTLQLGDGGTSGMIYGDVLNDGTLAFNRADDISFDEVISGSGRVRHDGPGELVLLGENSYAGGTVISEGTLQLGDGGSTGMITGDVSNGGTLAFDRSDDVTFDGVISGSGDLEQRGSGTLILMGNSSYIGDTTISAGTLQLGDGGTTGMIAGDVSNDGTLAFDRSDDVIFDGVISGSGGLEQRGSGTLILTGDSSYTGGTTISAGTLQLGDGGSTGMITGDVSNDGTLAFNRSDDVTFDGTISGAGQVQQIGPGTLTLTGNNSYSGGTSIIGGTISVSDDSNLGDASGELYLNDGTLAITGDVRGTRGIELSGSGTIAVAQDQLLVSGGEISGTGALIADGPGLLVLIGASTYSGGTILRDGLVGIGADDSLGAVTGGVTFDGGALQVSMDMVTGRTLDVASTGVLIADGDAILTLAGQLTGAGILALDGSGRVIVAADTGFSGTLLARDGVLQIGAGNAGMIAGDIVVGQAASLVFGRDNDAVFVGNTGGLGDLTKEGAGMLTITGTLGHGGGTTIAAGILEIAAGGAIAGDIVNNASLVFNPTTGLLYAGTLSGMGLLAKQGAGTLVLSGDSSAYSGNTDILGGQLLVNGSLGGGVTVTNALLGGSGSVGATTIASGGILAPGNSIGTLRFANGLNFGSGGVYAVEVRDGGNVAGVDNDLAEVTGAVNINSLARVQVRAESGTDTGATYAPDTTYTIITATDGVNGTFDSIVDEDFVFLDASLGYDPDKVYLTLKRNDLTFASVGQTANQQAVAGALGGFGNAEPVYQQILGLSAEGAQRAFDLASGEVHASGQYLIKQSFALFADSLGRGQGVVVAADNGPAAPLAYGPRSDNAMASLLAVDAALVATRPVHSMWLTPLAGRGTIEADGNGAQLDWQSGGLAAGYEVASGLAGGQARFGLGLGYLKGDGSVPDRLSSLSTEGGYAGIYGAWSDGPWSLAGSLAYGASHVDSRRDIIIGAINRTATADYWSHTAGISLEAAYGFQLSEGFTISPTGTLDIAWSGHNGATETGAGTLNALIDPASAWCIDTGLGVNLAYAFALDNGGGLTLKTKALWEHGFGDAGPEQTLALAGGGEPFTVAGPEAGRDRLKLGAGVSWSLSQATILGLDYTGTFADNQTSHGIQASVKVGF